MVDLENQIGDKGQVSQTVKFEKESKGFQNQITQLGILTIFEIDENKSKLNIYILVPVRFQTGMRKNQGIIPYFTDLNVES